MFVPSTLDPDTAALCFPQVGEDSLATLQAHLRDALPALRVCALDAALSDQDLSSLYDAYAAVSLFGSGVNTVPGRWYCAVDPVIMQADLRDVQIRRWPVDDLDETSALAFCSVINPFLADDSDPRLAKWQLATATPSRWFASVDTVHALSFHADPPAALNGLALRHYPVTGEDAGLVKRLTTEIQMLLHEHPQNQARTALGQSAINGVWIYGGGELPAALARDLPPIVTDQAFFRGCWQLSGQRQASIQSWVAETPLMPGLLYAPQAVSGVSALVEQSFENSALTRLLVLFPNGGFMLERPSLMRRLWTSIKGQR